MQLMQAQFYASFVWNGGASAFGQMVQINMDSSNLRNYEEYFQFHDPITPVMQRYRVAVRATDVLPQAELVRTEFFNDFLARDGLYWGVNLYAWEGGRNIGDMRIWRDRRRENFGPEDLLLLDMILPAFVAALSRARQTAGASSLELPPSVAARLSPRERETAELAAAGLQDKEIARRLGISITTVRTHLDHSFRKLGVTNRMGLVRSLGL